MPKHYSAKYENHGPCNALPYPNLGASVAKWRKVPKCQLGDSHVYANAIETAIKALQMKDIMGEATTIKAPKCASGTWHTTGEAIHRAMRQQQHTALVSAPDAIRRKRTDAELIAAYEEAMAEKRKREAGDA